MKRTTAHRDKVNVAVLVHGGEPPLLIRQWVIQHCRRQQCQRVRARLRTENAASVRAFQKAGFRPVTRVKDRGVSVIILHYRPDL